MDDTSLRVMQLNGQGVSCGQIILQLPPDDTGLESVAMAMAGLCEGIAVGDLCRLAADSWGGIRCDDIVAFQGGKKPEVCGDMMVCAREMLLRLLAENNIDPILPREDAGEY